MSINITIETAQVVHQDDDYSSVHLITNTTKNGESQRVVYGAIIREGRDGPDVWLPQAGPDKEHVPVDEKTAIAVLEALDEQFPELVEQEMSRICGE